MLQMPFRYRVKKLTNFEGAFDYNLAPTWAPTWPQVGLQEATKTLPKEHLQSYPAQDPKNDDQKHQKLPNTLPKSTLKKLRKQRRTLEKHTDNEHEKHQQTKRKSKQHANPSLKVGVLVFPVGARRDSRSAGSIRTNETLAAKPLFLIQQLRRTVKHAPQETLEKIPESGVAAYGTPVQEGEDLEPQGTAAPRPPALS